MKRYNKRKASKVTYKNHRKHHLLPKEEKREIPENIPDIKPSDFIDSNK